jgi:hypothetical protein
MVQGMLKAQEQKEKDEKKWGAKKVIKTGSGLIIETGKLACTAHTLITKFMIKENAWKKYTRLKKSIIVTTGTAGLLILQVIHQYW